MLPRISLSSIIKLSAFLVAVYFADIKLPEKNIPPKNNLVLIINKAPIDTEIVSKKIEYISALVVNRENKVRTVIKKNEIEGVKDIKNLADTSAYEEAWAYLPEKQEWHETGYNEKIINYEEFCESTLHREINYEEELSEENNKIFLYHLHPTDGSLEREIQEKEIDRNESNNEEEQYKNNEDYLKDIFDKIREACPSIRDLRTMIYYSIDCTKINPKTKIINKICSIHGVTEYYLTKKGFDYYKSYTIDVILKNPHTLSTKDSIKIRSDFIEIDFRSYKCLENMLN